MKKSNTRMDLKIEELKKDIDVFSQILKNCETKIVEYKKLDWKYYDKKDDCIVYHCNVEASPIKAFRSNLIIKTNNKTAQEIMSKILGFYTDEKEKLSFIEPNLKRYFTETLKGEEVNIAFWDMPMPMFVTDRFFLDVRRIVHNDNKSLCYGCSLPQEYMKKEYPQVDNYVRGNMRLFYLEVKEIKKGEIGIELIFHSELGGNLAYYMAPVVNRRAPEQAYVLLRYLKVMVDDNFI